MDGTFGGNPDVACQPADQEIADFAGAPMRLVALGVDDEAFELLRKLIGIAHRSTRSISEGFEPMLPIAVEDLVAGFTGDAELSADVRHRLPIQHTGYKAQALFHHRTRFPRHQHLPPKGEKCYPCVRYEMSPMSQAARLSGYKTGHSKTCRFCSVGRGSDRYCG